MPLKKKSRKEKDLRQKSNSRGGFNDSYSCCFMILLCIIGGSLCAGGSPGGSFGGSLGGVCFNDLYFFLINSFMACIQASLNLLKRIFLKNEPFIERYFYEIVLIFYIVFILLIFITNTFLKWEIFLNLIPLLVLTYLCKIGPSKLVKPLLINMINIFSLIWSGIFILGIIVLVLTYYLDGWDNLQYYWNILLELSRGYRLILYSYLAWKGLHMPINKDNCIKFGIIICTLFTINSLLGMIIVTGDFLFKQEPVLVAADADKNLESNSSSTTVSLGDSAGFKQATGSNYTIFDIIIRSISKNSMLYSLPKQNINCLGGWFNLDLNKRPIGNFFTWDPLWDNTPIRQDLINKSLLQKAKLGFNDTFLYNEEKVNSLYVNNNLLCVDMLLHKSKIFFKLRYDIWMKEGFFTLEDFFGKKKL